MALGKGERRKRRVALAAFSVLSLSTIATFRLLAILAGVPEGSGNIRPRQDYLQVAHSLTLLIDHELREKRIPSIAVALVDDQEIAWAQGFGFADPDQKREAGAGTVYRVGSVSKLFTDIGIMRLVEAGKLNLDAPVTDIIPDFHPHNPFGGKITLRELMSHRSGLVREPPKGHYFDSLAPGLAEVVQSLNESTLIYPPGSHTKYSNAGITVAGYALERQVGQPFTQYLKAAVLDRMGLRSSAFEPTSDLTRDLAKAQMWTYDGRFFPAPTFPLGTFPAGSLYTTVTDLGRFESLLFAGGRGPGGQVISKATLDQMWTPQSAGEEPSHFGLGFVVGELDGHHLVGHDGAIYGFATSLAALPDDKLGAVAVATLDSSNAVTDHIVTRALELMLAARNHQSLPNNELTTPVTPGLARRLAARYGTASDAVDLKEQEGHLYMLPLRGGYQVELRSLGDHLVVDDRLSYGPPVKVLDQAIQVRANKLDRIDVPKPAPPPTDWKDLIGEYGWDYDTLYILEKDGHLTALIEWYEFDPLNSVSKDEFQFPDHGLYDRERATFIRGQGGAVRAVRIGWVEFKRRQTGPVEGEVFRIKPLRPVDKLHREALAAQPPKESGDFLKPDLVELVKLDPSIRLDIRYAGTRNFLGTPMYRDPRAFMQRPAAEAVVRANQKLRELGFGLLIHDAYRPWHVTKMFWDAVPAEDHIFVADPSQGSRHNRGCAVDLTMVDLKTGEAVPMVSGYDEMTQRAYPFYPGGTSLQRWDRALLRHAMEDEGFTVYEDEWWHFDYKDWPKYPILNIPFDQVR